MNVFPLRIYLLAIIAPPLIVLGAIPAGSLPGTAPLTRTTDLSVEMVAGIGRYLDRETQRVARARDARWRTEILNRTESEQNLAAARGRLARMVGAIDRRSANPEIEIVGSAATPGRVAETESFTIDAVRWAVFDGVYGEGLWLRPKRAAIARVVAIPDADQTPEQIVRHHVRRLAENGCEVLVPTLVDRADRFSGSATVRRQTNQPHREWIYRQAFELGRHIIGYEVQKVLAAVDCFERANSRVPIGVLGWGEGGLLALHAAALDPRIAAAAVSGYFGPREEVSTEPIYRNVFGLLSEFGDAELARMIVPRKLIIEHTAAPAIAGPPAPRPGRAGAAPGEIVTPSLTSVQAETQRARSLAGQLSARSVAGAHSTAIEFHDHIAAGTQPFGDAALRAFLRALRTDLVAPPAVVTQIADAREGFDPVARQERQVRELERYTQRLLELSGAVREEFLWKKVRPTDAASWDVAMRPYREIFSNEVLGRLPRDEIPLNPRSRVVVERPAWVAHEIVLDVRPDVFAWGYLLLPRALKPGERRPVVVVQHGLEGVPADTINEDTQSRAFRAYKAYGARLAERGFIVFAPHNPYRGETAFRLLQRKANPLGLSLFSFIVAQHERILDWLAAQPNVDPKRIAFYGLSYGGKTAMRVPPFDARYCAVICSGDFNEWIWKNVTTSWPGSYMFTKEWEMFEFNLGSTFGYAEMAAMIAPRPFMVERGHDDGVAIDEWVAFEFAKVRRLYGKLGIGDRTEIEFFQGPHTINGVGTFKFLHRHLNWPESAAK